MRLRTVDLATDDSCSLASRMYSRHCKGYTLVEIAMVMVIVGVVLSTTLVSMGSMRDGAKYSDTEVYLEEARNALLGYALLNGYLPCPDTNGNGRQNSEESSGGMVCTDSVGGLPFLDLELDRNAPWGANGRYAINLNVDGDICAAAATGVCFFEDEGAPAFSLTTPPIGTDAGTGNLQVTNTDGDVIAQDVIAVVWSSGKNALQTEASCSGISDNEIENCDADASYIMDSIRSAEGSAFDDQLIWIHANILKGQMRDAGLL